MNRRGFIGGSDLGPIFGIRPFAESKTRVDLWLEKTGKREPEPETQAMRLGHALEPVILQEYEAMTDRHVHPWAGTCVDRDWRMAHLDAVARVPGPVANWDRVVECKATAARRRMLGQPGTDQVPLDWLLQGQWYAELGDYPYIDFVVMPTPTQVDIYTAERCPDLFKLSDEVAGEFWHKNVGEGIPPEPVCLEDCQNLWSTTTRKLVTVSADLGPKLDSWQDEYHKLTAIEKQAGDRKKTLKQRYRTVLRDGQELRTDDGKLWATCAVNAAGARVLSVKKPKKARR